MKPNNEAVLRDAYLALMNLEYVNPNAEDNCDLYGHGFLAAKMKALAMIHPALAATATVGDAFGLPPGMYSVQGNSTPSNPNPPVEYFSISGQADSSSAAPSDALTAFEEIVGEARDNGNGYKPGDWLYDTAAIVRAALAPTVPGAPA